MDFVINSWIHDMLPFSEFIFINSKNGMKFQLFFDFSYWELKTLWKASLRTMDFIIGPTHMILIKWRRLLKLNTRTNNANWYMSESEKN